MEALKLLAVAAVGLLLSETSSSAVTVTLTSNPTGTVFCNGSEVIFTCETRESDILTWARDGFYVGARISFGALLDRINDTRNSLSTVATLTQNYMEDGVRVLVSTLRIIATSAESSGYVMCARESDDAGGTGARIDFQVFAPPAVPQHVATFQFQHVQNMCTITSVLRSPINPAEADATTYIVSVNGSSVPYNNATLISTNGTRHSALVYNSTCGAHRISISAINICGESPGTDEIVLDPEQRLVLNVILPNNASNIECSLTTAIVGVVLSLLVFKYLT